MNTRTAHLSPEQSFVVRLDALRREFEYNGGGGRLQFDPAMREAMVAAEKAAYAYRRANPFCERCGAVGGEYENQINGDKKKAFLNKKTGRPEHRWQRVHANHAHDLEAMQVDVAMMLSILIPPEPAKEEPVTNEEKK